MRHIFRALSAVLVLVAIALISALITMRLAIHGAEVHVPSLSGLTLEEAATELHAKGLETGVDGHFFSTTQPIGHVLTQSPASGTLVRKSWRVRVTISLGPQKLAVPSVEQMDEGVAAITIHRLGLQLGDVISISSDSAAENTVVAQTPLAGAKDVGGPKVSLLTAKPLASQADSSVMPDLTGETFTAAALSIIRAGFQLAPLQNPASVKLPATAAPIGPASSNAPVSAPVAVSPAAPSGTVIGQSPTAGSRIATGSTIRLTVQP